MCRATDKNTNKEKFLIERYNNSTERSIYKIYKKPSEQKIAVYEYYLSECFRLGGHGFKILSHNAFYVTFAYILHNTLVIITPSRKIFISCETR